MGVIWKEKKVEKMESIYLSTGNCLIIKAYSLYIKERTSY